MRRKYIVVLVVFLLGASIELFAAMDERPMATPISEVLNVQAPAQKGACAMTYTNGMVAFFMGFEDIVGVYTYYDPAAQCATPVYPYGITSFAFMLFDFGGLGTVDVDIVVYDLSASGLICDGPGEELCRMSVTVTSFMPTTVTYSFPDPCLVNQPFFIGIEYVTPPPNFPKVVMDNQGELVDTCYNWVKLNFQYYEWLEVFGMYGYGLPLFWVDGETAEDSGACCYDPTGLGVDAACLYTTQTDCEQILGGVFEGVDVPCSAAPEACCLPDGNCVMADPLCCVNELGGTPQGAGSDCAATIACCLPDGSCQTVSLVCCDDLGGTPSPFGAQMCLGDLNGDGTDDACQVREDRKWRQAPDLDATGVDIDASCPSRVGECNVVADDFLCIQTGPITEIHIYGSWLHDGYPLGDPGQVTFTLSLHNDVPAGVDLSWSHPGEVLWMHTFAVGEFEVRPYARDIVGDLYSHGFTFIASDSTCWEYIFDLRALEPFIQQGSETEPVVYWLDIQAVPEDQSVWFGWKTTIDHWNDAGVWAFVPEPVDPLMWVNLDYRYGHPWAYQRIDLAFEIYGDAQQPCDCIPGDANGDGFFPPFTGGVNIGDAVYLINYVFKGGPGAVPYPLCSGDANCDCQVNVGDAVYIISYVFKGGPPPCDCPTWVSDCGPLQK